MSETGQNINFNLWETFRGEAREHLQAMSQSLLELEKKPFPEPRLRLIDSAFRSAHSLKGAAAVVRQRTVVNVCQAIETIFGRLKRGELKEDAELFDILQGAVDTIHDLIGTPTDSGLPPDSVPVIRSLQQVAGSDAGRPAATNTARLRRPRTVRLFRNRGELVEEPAKTNRDNQARSRKATTKPLRESLPIANMPARDEISASLTSHSMHRAQVGNTVRLDVEKLDELLRRVEELTASLRLERQITEDTIELLERSANAFQDLQGLEDILRRLANGMGTPDDIRAIVRVVGVMQRGAPAFTLELRRQADRQTAERQRILSMVDSLRVDVRRMLMLPFATLLTSFPRMVRDLARDLDKLAELDVEGAAIEVSRQILDELRDPLVHILRNAIDHGIEPPADREAAGKPRLGTITLGISRVPTDMVEIVISDDGAGINLPRLKARAVEAGVIDTIDAAGMDDASALELIFRADVSTAERVNTISGRGLGMAIVRERLDHMGGSISVFTETGEGTTYRIMLPSSLATTRAIRIHAGEQEFLVPSLYIERILRVAPEEIIELDAGTWIDVDGRRLPVADLATTLGLASTSRGGSRVNLLICQAGTHRVAFRVAEIMHEADILVKPLGPVLAQVPNFSGAAVVRNGELILILNVVDLIQAATLHVSDADINSLISNRRPRLLIVDDMRTMRQYLASVLAEAGYDITVAADGAAAWKILRSDPVDLVLCDVQMPSMDGHELARRIRAHFGAVPAIVMLSSQETQEDVQAGIDAGCDAYLQKSELSDDLLLEMIASHLPSE